MDSDRIEFDRRTWDEL